MEKNADHIGVSQERIDELDAIADAFFGAASSGDMKAMAAVCAADLRVWHVRDEAYTDFSQVVELHDKLHEMVTGWRYEIKQRFYARSGFSQQHVLHGELKDGSALRIPVSCVCTLDGDDKVHLVEEYFDPRRSPLLGWEQESR